METHIKKKEHNDKSDSSSICREKIKKYELTAGLREDLKEMPEVLAFIVKLQECIEKQKKKLSKWKKKRQKVRKKMKSVATQTESLEERNKSITEQITEAAQEAMNTNGFVYEETSGMYYDYNSGYYYNAEYGLYYDGNTGTYLKYNQETKEYDFHSQVAIPTVKSTIEKPTKDRKKKIKRKGNKPKDNRHASKRAKHQDDDDLEEGECSDNSWKSHVIEIEGSTGDDDNSCDSLDRAKLYPPCMRIIIEETNVPNFKQGSLHIITYEGGTLGREGNHSILIPDINISKFHLNITFDKENKTYLVTDVGSRNGTYLNGKRLSPSKMESDPSEVLHGSRLQIGGTIMLCHIHVGSQTCGHCEPGLVQTKDDQDKEDLFSIKSDKLKNHKEQLKILRKKFGISKMEHGKVNPGEGYTDRAQVRRATVGSQNPHEKTKVASLNESIDSDNKGFKMLAKMGWKEGQALGKDNQGRLEPVQLVSNAGTSGIGNTVIPVSVEITKEIRKNKQIWEKTQERYKQIPVENENIFEEV